MRRIAMVLLASVSMPAFGQSVGHVHNSSCNHQWSDNQGELSVGGLDADIEQYSLSNATLPGMTFILNNLGGVGAGSDALRGFQAAAAMWSRILKDPVTIRLDVRFAQLAPNVLGSTGSTTNTVNYTGLALLLAADSKSVWDASAVATLQAGPALAFVSNEPPTAGAIDSRTRFLDNNGTFDNNNIQINTAQVKALGLNPIYAPSNTSLRDGTVSFSNQFVWDFDPTDGITAGSIDFVGVAAHEIGHALGFRSGVDLADNNALPGRAGPGGARGLNNIAWGTVQDLYRYGAFNGEKTLDWSIGGSPCYSINGGANCIAPLSTGSFNGDRRQASHWKDDTLLGGLPIGIMDPTASGPGGTRPLMKISKFDRLAFDVMGYDLAVPEPGTWMMLIAGFGLVGATMRRRRAVEIAQIG